MPTYDYECDACGNRFEKFQTMSSPAIKKCPKCGKLKVRRLVGTGAGIIFKGSGFYITDYRSEGYKNDQKADTNSGSSSSSSESKDKPTSESVAPAADAKPAATESKSEAAKSSGDSSASKSESKSSKSSESKPSSSAKKKK